MTSPIRVLVADDEHNLRELLVRELSRKGHAVEGVGAAAGSNDGRAGLAEEFGQRRRDTIVVLDEQHVHGADAMEPAA